MEKSVLVEKLQIMGACQRAIQFVEECQTVEEAYATASIADLIWLGYNSARHPHNDMRSFIADWIFDLPIGNGLTYKDLSEEERNLESFYRARARAYEIAGLTWVKDKLLTLEFPPLLSSVGYIYVAHSIALMATYHQPDKNWFVAWEEAMQWEREAFYKKFPLPKLLEVLAKIEAI